MPQYADPMWYSLAVVIIPVIVVGLTKITGKQVTKLVQKLRCYIVNRLK